MDIDSLIIPGKRYRSDNFFLGGCDEKLLKGLSHYISLLFVDTDLKAIVVNIDATTQEMFSKSMKNLEAENIDRDILAPLFVNSLVLREIYRVVNEPELLYNVDSNLNMMAYNFSKDKFKDFYINSPSKMLITRLMEESNIYDVDFIISVDTNKYLQSAINDYIFERSPQCIKVFSSSEQLSHPYTTSGQPVQSVHDYSYYEAKEFNQDISL